MGVWGLAPGKKINVAFIWLFQNYIQAQVAGFCNRIFGLFTIYMAYSELGLAPSNKI